MDISWLLSMALTLIHLITLCSSKDNVTKRECDVKTMGKLRKAGHVRQYFYCDQDGTIKAGDCPTGMIFDWEIGACSRDWQRRKRQTSIVGITCQENIDCQTTDGGAYCDQTKRCDCLASHININGFCWAKRNPGEGCAYQQQCESTSLNAVCSASGVCECSNGMAPQMTDDGPVCLLPGECPTNGINSKLREPSGADISCETSADCTDGTPDRNSYAEEDIYTCFCPTAKSRTMQCMNEPMSYCCLKRASTCIQPKDEGNFNSGAGFHQRWWFNSITSNCEVLTYRGSGGNANNFVSKALCESYCKTACPRGNPAYALVMDPRGTLSPAKCTQTSPCANEKIHYCHSQETSGVNLCCPHVSYICGAKGGLFHNLVEMPDKGDRSYGLNPVTRYYYNPDSKTCSSFSFNGMGGSFNSFQSEAECRQFCAGVTCEIGEPLRDESGLAVTCGSSGGSVCPAKYTCTSGSCCPTIDFACALPQAIGGCSSFVERWWFNKNTRGCEKFFYSGCQGNANNFETYKICDDKCGKSKASVICPQGEPAKDSSGTNYLVCSGTSTSVVACPNDYYCHYDGKRYGCCPTRTKTCSNDLMNRGTRCVTPVSRWYYNAQTKKCDVFIYDGCDGNSNNFATQTDCQDYCSVGGCPEGGEPLKEGGGQIRMCGSGGSTCPAGYTCSFINTDNTATRSYRCCPTRTQVCSLPQDQGLRCGMEALNRYYFNSITRTCEMFSYNGCAGNRNNFASMEQCLQYCNSAGCPAGQVVLQDMSSSKVITCNHQESQSCPTGYSCIMSPTLQQGVCCGSNAQVGSCPTGQIAFMDSLTNAPLQCQPNVENSCPAGIFCQYSFTMQNAFCCSTSSVQCKNGGSPFLDPVSNQAQQCSPGLTGVCPGGYSCETSSVNVGGVSSVTGYCCGQPNTCGSGYEMQLVSNQPIRCNIGQYICTPPAVCRQNANDQSGFCCVPVSQPVCGIGKQPLLTRGVPTLCTMNAAGTGCPGGFTCDLYQPTGSYYCCGRGVIVPTVTPPVGGSCPAPYVMIQPVRPCSPGVSGSCPVGAICAFDSSNQRYVCCGRNAVEPSYNACPNGRQTYMNQASGQPQLCALGSSVSGCPFGYSCAYSSTARNYLCCSSQSTSLAQCPFPQTAITNPITGQPMLCMLGDNSCPFGSQCTRSPTGDSLCCSRLTAARNTNEDHGCRSGRAFLYPGTKTPLSCTLNGPSCPSGFSCQRSTLSNSLLCCSTSARG